MNKASAWTNYGYDPVSRLASLAHDMAGTGHDVTSTFAYNPASQIKSKTRDNDAYAWTGHGSGTTAYILLRGADAVQEDPRDQLPGSPFDRGPSTYGDDPADIPQIKAGAALCKGTGG